MNTALLVRNLDAHIKTRLKARATAHQVSLEEEVRRILSAAAAQPLEPAQSGLGTLIQQSFKGVSAINLKLPTRQASERAPLKFR
jgi:antitoxin FitA